MTHLHGPPPASHPRLPWLCLAAGVAEATWQLQKKDYSRVARLCTEMASSKVYQSAQAAQLLARLVPKAKAKMKAKGKAKQKPKVRRRRSRLLATCAGSLPLPTG